MNKQDIFKNMVATASQLSVEQLKEQIIKFYNDDSSDDDILNALLSALQTKVSVAEFVSFADEIY